MVAQFSCIHPHSPRPQASRNYSAWMGLAGSLTQICALERQRESREGERERLAGNATARSGEELTDDSCFQLVSIFLNPTPLTRWWLGWKAAGQNSGLLLTSLLLGLNSSSIPLFKGVWALPSARQTAGQLQAFPLVEPNSGRKGLVSGPHEDLPCLKTSGMLPKREF